MRWQRRVVLVSAAAADGALQDQLRTLAAWPGAQERDVSVVAIAGGRVTGAADAASSLRKRYGLPADRFMTVLVGKDGHVALRSSVPVEAQRLEQAIDAMPMRRAGER